MRRDPSLYFHLEFYIKSTNIQTKVRDVFGGQLQGCPGRSAEDEGALCADHVEAVSAWCDCCRINLPAQSGLSRVTPQSCLSGTRRAAGLELRNCFKVGLGAAAA